MSSSSPSSSAPGGGVDTVINPGIIFVVAVLAIVFFVCGLLHLLVRHLLRRRRAREDAGSVTAFQGQLQELFHLHDAGVDQAFIDAQLPVFMYKDVVGGGGGGGDAAAGGKDPFDCAVCLCEFEPDDELRLLPKCSHAFHLECIDTWLLSHSTCPLCRRSLLAGLSPARSPVDVMVLDSESFRDMADSARRAGVDAAADVEPGSADGVPADEGAEEVVQVKLGKFMCVEVNAGAMAGAGDEAATSSNVNGDGDGDGDGEASLGKRRCHSMGSYEYIMEEHASLHVAIKPPPKKKPAAFSKARRGGAISECEFGASKRGGESSLRWPRFPTATTVAQKQQQPPDMATAKLTKDSFSESKIWMMPPSKRAAERRRTVSFRWPVSSKEDEAEGNTRKSGSEAEWDVEGAGSCGNHSIVSSMAEEERPSFARRTLLWVGGGGGRQQSSRVGSCS